MKDENGFIVDQGGDGGDSCNFSCALSFFNEDRKEDQEQLAYRFTDINADPVRHPHQEPWNNKSNFTVDQAVPFIAIASPGLVRTYFKRHWLFAPNTERDWPGSKKMKRPHEFFRDSHLWLDNEMMIDATTCPLHFNWKTFKWEGQLTSNYRHEIERKMFDSPDVHQGPFFGLLIMRAKYWWLYWLLPFCWFWCLGSIWAYKKYDADSDDNDDFKQLFILSTFYNLDRIFCHLVPGGLYAESYDYFVKARNLPELHTAFVNYCKRRGIYEHIKAP
jgi:hypothetical protein